MLRPQVACLLLQLLLAETALGLDRPVVVSVYQGPCKDGDFAANIATARTVIDQARSRGSQFLAFPESFLSGSGKATGIPQGARSLDDPELRAFVAESGTHELAILAGLVRRSGSNLFNSVMVIHRGRLLGVYDKVLLAPDDRTVLGFSPGNALPVFEAHGARFGILIGSESSYPHLAMAARLQGAEILFTPHDDEIAESNVDDHIRWVRNTHIGLATQFQVAVARANTIRSERPGQLGYGDSFILGPQGNSLSDAGLFRTELRTALITPVMFESPNTWAEFQDAPAWVRTGVADLLKGFRSPTSRDDLRYWLENMVTAHGFSRGEIAAATGLGKTELDAALEEAGLTVSPPKPAASPAVIRVLPYPGGRHPRLGFFDGARNPQRETKASVFPPWEMGGYVVVDVPEAIFSNLGLIYLAHSHIPTIWDQQGVELPRLEWARSNNGSLHHTRVLPNGIAFGADVQPRDDGVELNLWLRNGTTTKLTGLRVQNCVMLGRAAGFASQSSTNKVFRSPFAAVRSRDDTRWVITAWEECGRTWGNELVPCIHSDPVLPDCPPGETVQVRGWLSFYQGTDIDSELKRLATLGVPARRIPRP